MKHKNSFYLQLSREIWTEKYKSLSIGAKWVFVTLNELEQRFCGDGESDFFYRTDEELAKDTGYSIATLRKYKAELKKTDLIKVSYGRYKDKSTGKKSEERYTAYKILK